MKIKTWFQEPFHHRANFDEKILDFLICPKTVPNYFTMKKKDHHKR